MGEERRLCAASAALCVFLEAAGTVSPPHIGRAAPCDRCARTEFCFGMLLLAVPERAPVIMHSRHLLQLGDGSLRQRTPQNDPSTAITSFGTGSLREKRSEHPLSLHTQHHVASTLSADIIR